MFEKKSKLRLVGAFAALASLGLAISCHGFFVDPTVTSLAIGPSNLTLTPDTSFQMTATATYNDGSTSDVTGKAIWTSTDQTVAAFTSPGDLKAVPLAQLSTLPGQTTVSASIGTVTSSTQTVNVCPVIQTLQLTVNNSTSSATVTAPAQPKFVATATFNGVSGTTDVTAFVTWNIGSNTIVSIDNTGTGTTTSGTDGTTSVSASVCGSTSNTVSLTVQG